MYKPPKETKNKQKLPGKQEKENDIHKQQTQKEREKN